MKLIFLSLVFIFVSCGKIEESENANTVGEIWSVSGSDTFSSSELEALTLICTALKSKQNYLDIYLITAGKKMYYEVENTACYDPNDDSTKETTTSTISSFITKTANGYFYSNSEGLYSSQVIDQSHSLVSGLCSAITAGSDSINTVEVSDDLAILYRISNSINNSKCTTSEGLCLSILYGSKVETQYYKTISQIIIGVNLSSATNKKGLVDSLVYENSKSCDEEGNISILSQSLQEIK